MLTQALTILAEAERLSLPFKKLALPSIHDAVYFVAKDSLWTITVVRFEIESQGFPKGSVGYDGMVRKGGVIVRMTRKMAERIFSNVTKSQQLAFGDVDALSDDDDDSDLDGDI